MKVYLLVFRTSYEGFDRDKMLEFLDTVDEVSNWSSVFATAVFIVSELSATQLTDRIHAKFPKPWFFITEINHENDNGILLSETWEFINNPKAAETEG